MQDMMLWEREVRQKGFHLIAGVDEAGRGPLAGRVYAAAVILPDHVSFSCRVDDSKKLSEKRRKDAFCEIIQKAVSYAIAYADEQEIDEINILNATHLAMNRAVASLTVCPDFVLIDGNSIRGMKVPHETIVKGDGKSFSIAAASILAKVSRDEYIIEQSKLYPQYGFEKHKGYPTAQHLAMIKEWGPCPIHRKTFKGVREYVKK